MNLLREVVTKQETCNIYVLIVEFLNCFKNRDHVATNGFFRPLIVESDLEEVFMINDKEPYFPSKGIIEDEIRLLMEAVQIS